MHVYIKRAAFSIVVRVHDPVRIIHSVFKRTLQDRSKSSTVQLSHGQMDGWYWSNAVFKKVPSILFAVRSANILLRGVSAFAR